MTSGSEVSRLQDALCGLEFFFFFANNNYTVYLTFYKRPLKPNAWLRETPKYPGGTYVCVLEDLVSQRGND